ncbi:MAG TPA: UDP-glucose--hexose-1-phosphate uridylyltransferase [Acidobacteriaceae bacterium]|nr:UDP-glucose--hexose-1-phosphate uridylyltransferase [Acidobacteriaceae bacterium]
MTESLQFPHRRFNPLKREWVLVSPHRTDRPWQGEVNKTSGFSGVHYDPQCYLCPGNTRAGGKVTPPYESVYIFDNDYAALLPDSADPVQGDAPELLRAERERGRCRVVCFHPDHSLTLARMQVGDIRKVVDAWTEEYRTLGAVPEFRHVQIFENRGAMMGASNPHPHCQIWATEHVPNDPLAETEAQAAYRASHGTCLLCDYARLEAARSERVVCENDRFLAVVPWWAVWPFETLVVAKQHRRSLLDFEDEDRVALADILKQVTTRYDNLFETSFPYTMGFHQAPCDGEAHDEWHFHAHFLPPLLRSAAVRKYMVGFELMAMPQRDITPETAAERLRMAPPGHFMDAQGSATAG